MNRLKGKSLRAWCDSWKEKRHQVLASPSVKQELAGTTKRKNVRRVQGGVGIITARCRSMRPQPCHDLQPPVEQTAALNSKNKRLSEDPRCQPSHQFLGCRQRRRFPRTIADSDEKPIVESIGNRYRMINQMRINSERKKAGKSVRPLRGWTCRKP
ncbi:unnamed protein product [Arctogadus glacialis]